MRLGIWVDRDGVSREVDIDELTFEELPAVLVQCDQLREALAKRLRDAESIWEIAL